MVRAGLYARGFALLASLVGCIGTAMAQDAPAVTPSTRAIPDTEATTEQADQALYAAKGLPLGGFRLFPKFEFDTSYDDNVYRTDAATQDDYFFTLSPTLDLVSQWARHRLELRATMSDYQYSRLSTENHTDYNVEADGHLDLLRGLTADGTVSYMGFSEPRTSEDLSLNALSPTRFSIFHANAKVEHALGRLGVQVGGRYDDYTFDPTHLIGGTLLDNRDRNRTEYEVYTKADYEFSPGYAVFVRGTYDDRSYELTTDANGFDRNSNGYRIDGGVDLLISKLLEGSAYIGYLRQNYKAPLNNVSGIDFGAGLTWHPTRLITVRLNAERLIDETTIVNASANDEQDVTAKLDYAVYHNIVLQAGAGYMRNRYTGANRSDDTVTADIGAKYLMNEYLQLSVKYEYNDRASPLPIYKYRDNTVMLGLGLQL